MSTHYTLFETAIGWAGLAWSERGLVGAHLPETDPEVVRRSFARRFPEASPAEPPLSFSSIIAGVQALMRGEKADLTSAPLDIGRVPEFNARVYAVTQSIPAGETLTYGQVAEVLGDKLLARDVGAALGQNPWPMIVPCHRVTAAGGKLGGFSARGGAQTKARLLVIEGAATVQAPPKPAQQDLFS